MSTAPVTLLFTDLVNSTELLERAGDEHTQRILRTHHLALQQAVAIHGGSEVKWLGDGLMSVFASPADAVRCAVAMQQAARRRVAGEQLAIRVGLSVGESLREEADYFGTSVVVLGPAHAQTVAGTFSREAARHYLFERALRSTDELGRLGRLPSEPRAKSKVVFGTSRSPFDHEAQIHLLESGAEGGRFSAVIPGWVGNYDVMGRVVAPRREESR